MADAMTLAQTYRDHAARERSLAEAANLAQVGKQHETAAEKWLQMADLADRVGAGSDKRATIFRSGA